MKVNPARIKELREERGWSQEDLAHQAKVDPSTIKKIVTGKTANPLPGTLRRIAEALGVRIDAIIDRTDEALPVAAPPSARRYLDFEPLDPPPLARLPGPPERFLGREDVMNQLLDRVFRVFEEVPPQRTRNHTFIWGGGGNGKTTLLRALLNHDRVTARFGPNRLWAQVGPNGDPCAIITQWCAAWGVMGLTAGWTPKEGQERLTHRIGHRPVLICIDDIWEEDHFSPLTVGGARCCIVVTTRRTTLTNRFAPDDRDRIPLGGLTPEDGIELLRVLAGATISDEDCRNIYDAVRGHALALELAGMHLRCMISTGKRVAAFLKDLQTRTQEIMRFQIPPDSAAFREEIRSDPTLFGLYSLSTSRLDGPTHYRLAYAANIMIPEPSTFDLEDVTALWGTTEEDAQRTLTCLVGEGLLHVAKEQRYQVHQMLHLYAKVFMRS